MCELLCIEADSEHNSVYCKQGTCYLKTGMEGKKRREYGRREIIEKVQKSANGRSQHMGYRKEARVEKKEGAENIDMEKHREEEGWEQQQAIWWELECVYVHAEWMGS